MISAELRYYWQITFRLILRFLVGLLFRTVKLCFGLIQLLLTNVCNSYCNVAADTVTVTVVVVIFMQCNAQCGVFSQKRSIFTMGLSWEIGLVPRNVNNPMLLRHSWFFFYYLSCHNVTKTFENSLLRVYLLSMANVVILSYVRSFVTLSSTRPLKVQLSFVSKEAENQIYMWPWWTFYDQGGVHY